MTVNGATNTPYEYKLPQNFGWNVGGTQQVSGGERTQFVPKLQKVENNPWAQVTNPLENGHDGSNQYVNKKVGYCNPICVA